MPAPQTEVILRHAGAELARVTLPPGEYIIGRDPNAGIYADTPLLSRKHALLTIREDAMLIEDLRSSNGTFIEQQPVAGTALIFPGQNIRLGDVALQIVRAENGTGPTMNMAWALAEATPQPPEGLRGDRKYEIGAEVARGGMGAIREAQQTGMDRRVAMKVMLEGAEEADVARFVNEAKITGRLEHPNIVPVHEMDVDAQGKVFYTMKFVRGITLKKVLELLADGMEATVKKYPLPALLTIFQKACDAVAFAHSKGVIHRDLKPENIMLGDFGEVLVMDWGLAKIVSSPEFRVSGSPSESASSGKPETRNPKLETSGSTMAGTIMGTPQYMAPEQARGEVETMDQRADIYALGAILFHVLALRPSVSGDDAMTIVTKVARGDVEPLTSSKSAGKLSPNNIPASLVAVVRQAMALDPAQRYPRVEDLQADLTAYQNGFATSAEKAGLGKQLVLALKRHKVAAAGIAAVLLVGTAFGTKAVLEGRRAERALADLKRQAPTLRQLADSEAGFQRFESALDKLDAALALDPTHLPSYWRRAWLLLGQEDFVGAASTIRLAQQKDPGQAKLAAILPTIDALAAAPEATRWTPERARALYDHLNRVGAAGEALVLSKKLTLGAKEEEKLVRARLDEWLGKNKGRVELKPDGAIHVTDLGPTINTVEPLRGLPINGLSIGNSQVTDLTPLQSMPLQSLYMADCKKITSIEPLRGMKLTHLTVYNCEAVSDWSPLTGMPIRMFLANGARFRDVSFLKGAPLEHIGAAACGVVDISALRGAPLRYVNFNTAGISTLEPLAESPLEELYLSSNPISDLGPLRGKSLRVLEISSTKVADLSPLRGAPIEQLTCDATRITDFRPLLDLPKLAKITLPHGKRAIEALRTHPTLRFLRWGSDQKAPHLTAEEFWKQFDAWLDKTQPGKEAIARLETVRKEKERHLGTRAITDLRSVDLGSETRLNLSHNPFSDLAPLRGRPLRELHLGGTNVTDLTPLRGMPLLFLVIDRTSITDVSPLLELPELEFVKLPKAAQNIELLRQHPALKYIGWEGDWDFQRNHPKVTAAEFWQRFDAERAAKR